MKIENKYSAYYQAHAVKETLWFVMGAVRAEEYTAFARTLDVKNNILEFFVAPGYENHFLSLMDYMKKNNFITTLEKKENRLKDGNRVISEDVFV